MASAGMGGSAGAEAARADGGAHGGAEPGSSCSVQSCQAEKCEPLFGDGRCDAPFPLITPGDLDSGWAHRVVRGDTRCGARLTTRSLCASRAPALAFDVELEAATELLFELDAAFDASLRLEQGDCSDPLEHACNEDHAEGVRRAVIAYSAEAGRYRLLVTGEGAEDAGAFQLSASARRPGAVCLQTPPHDSCGGAIDLDPTLAVQTVVGSTRCARDDGQAFFECAWDGAADVFYRLDLREREASVVLRASTDLVPTNFSTSLYLLDAAGGNCFAPLVCNNAGPVGTQHIEGSSELIAALDPAEYYLAVEGLDEFGEFGLRVSIDEIPCTSHDECAGALELDPVSGEQSVSVSLVCATASRATSCGPWYPRSDVFYRLDLSRFDGPVRMTAAVLDPDFAMAVLDAAADGSCGSELYCQEELLDVVLAPGTYYLLIVAPFEGPSRTELVVELEPAEPSKCCGERG